MSSFKPSQKSKLSVKCRRIADRRNFHYEFGSGAWIENIKNYYLAWPKHDRREVNRRENERRALQRTSESAFKNRHSEENNLSFLLTREERMMIQDLYLSSENN